MSIIAKGLAAFAFVAAIGLGGSADAAIMRAAFAGVTSNNAGGSLEDGLGLFGPPGPISEGEAWSAVFIYDTSDPVAPGCACLAGGGIYSRPSPFRSATFSLRDVDFVFGPADGEYGLTNLSLDPDHLTMSYSASILEGVFGLDLNLLSTYPHGVENLATAWSRTGGTYGYGAFYKFNELGTATTEFGLVVNSVSIAPVPEPTTWALLILGFGGVGATFRRRTIAA